MQFLGPSGATPLATPKKFLPPPQVDRYRAGYNALKTPSWPASSPPAGGSTASSCGSSREIKTVCCEAKVLVLLLDK